MSDENEFFTELENIYYEKLLERIETLENTSDIHSQIRIMDPKILRSEYRTSIKNCFRYLVLSLKSTLSKKDIDLIKEKENRFINYESSELFDLLNNLDLAMNDVLQNVSNSDAEGIIKGLKAGADGAAAGSIIPGVGTVLGGIIGVVGGWIEGDKIDKEEQHYLDRWYSIYCQVMEEFDSLWNIFCEMLEDIASESSEVSESSEIIDSKVSKDTKNKILIKKDIINIMRGQRLDLKEIVPSINNDFQIAISTNSSGLVIDFACFGLDLNKKLSDENYMIFFNQNCTPCGGISIHNISENRVDFALAVKKLPTKIHRLAFTAAIDGNATMSQLANGELRFISNGSEMARFSFVGSDFSKERAVILLEIYLKENVWRVAALGQGFNGGLEQLVHHFGGTTI